MIICCYFDSVVKKQFGLHGNDFRAFTNTIPSPAWGMCSLQDLASHVGLVLVMFKVFELTPQKEKKSGHAAVPMGKLMTSEFYFVLFLEGH